MEHFSDDEVRTTPPMAIARYIESARPQVHDIAMLVIAKSGLAKEIGSLLHTTAAIHEQLAMLKADEKLSAEMHAALASAAIGSTALDEAGMAGLPPQELQAQKSYMLANLETHLADLRKSQASLMRGIDVGRTTMIARFSRAAAEGVAADTAPAMPRGVVFMLAYLVAATLKDRLQAPGFLCIGENALSSLYVTAVWTQNRRKSERYLSDPMASAIATELGFSSAKQLHQSLHAVHEAATGENVANYLSFVRRPQPRTAPQDDSASQLAGRSSNSVVLEAQFLSIMNRARQSSLAEERIRRDQTKPRT